MSSHLLKTLQISYPRGVPMDTDSLRRWRVSSSLAHQYVKSGWLERLGRGVYMFAGDMLARDATTRFVGQNIKGFHVGGKTALARHGYGQNVSHLETLQLWGVGYHSLPQWFTARFPARYSGTKLFDDSMATDYCLAVLPEAPQGPLVASPERALLEMLSDVGVKQEAAEARQIMESIRSLRIPILRHLMEHCGMVKAVRLCVSWAEEFGLAWADEARAAAAGKLGTGRWIRRLANGTNLIIKP